MAFKLWTIYYLSPAFLSFKLMKKFLLVLVASLLVSVLPLNAQELRLGLCRGRIAGTGTIKSQEAKTWVSGAIYIPASTLRTFAGNQITAIRAALAARPNIEELKVWLRSSLEGENLVEKSITRTSEPAVMKGWNNVVLDQPFDITANTEGLYIGYSFYQAKPAFGLSTIEALAEGGLFYQFSDEDWTDHSAEGTLCIEAVVEGDNLPEVNLAIANLKIPEIYVADREKMIVEGTVWNRAAATITGFDLKFSVEGANTYSRHFDVNLPHNETYNFRAEVPIDESVAYQERGSLSVEVCNINEGSDHDILDNTARADFSVLRHEFKHNILVEEFTTEKCVNCPRVGTYIHESLQKERFKDNVVVICHHAGYHTDWLTTSFDSEYLWLYNDNGSTYAPAIMIERDAYGGTTPVLKPSSQNFIEEKWDEALSSPAFVSININANLDAAGEHLNVDVSGMKIKETICENPHLTVYIVEDNIPAKNQGGAEQGWIHHHVNRTVNTAWGAPIDFSGDDYSYSYEFTLSPDWVKENLNIVACISNYNPNNPADCKVANTESVSLYNAINSIDYIAPDSSIEPEIYTLTGVKVKNKELTPGIYIRKHGAHTDKFVVQ